MDNQYIYYYLIINILNTYVVFRYFDMFYKNDKRRGKFYFGIMPLFYYSCISIVHLVYENPNLTLITNLILFYMIALSYQNTLKKRLFSVLMIYLVLLFSECIAVLSVFLFTSDNNSILGFAISQIISLMVLELFNRKYSLEEDILIPKLQSIILFIFPLGSIILFYNSITYTPVEISLLNLSMLLIFIILVYYIFDEINKSYKEVLNHKIRYSNKILEMEMYEQEKLSYQNQFEILEEKQKQIESLKHDMKNHILGLEQLIENGNKQEFDKYINRMDIFKQTDFVDTGNVVVDSLLNYKIAQAEKKNITVNIDIKIPSKLNIESFDIIVILGNLLQNSIEALEFDSDNKVINIKINYDISCLYIMIENNYKHEIKVDKNEKILTNKIDSKNHGIGLENIKRSVSRYNGLMDIDMNNNKFKVDILLYLP